ncbi:MAG: DUF2723 domain-containing protein [Bacteroidota bacterium]
MKGTLIDRLVAAGVFASSLVLYLMTVAPTASFWDSGEFIAIADGLQVSHPPGAPFYMLVGRLFSMVFGPVLGLFMASGYTAVAINLVSVLASALTILLTHLVVVRLVRIWQGTPDVWSGADRLAALGGGVVGAMTFAVTDSFWFNAVESEVYALSMFFTAIVVWLILRWREEKLEEEAALRAQGEHLFGLKSDRYLVLIAYLFGLAIGVHLLNVLTLFFIALVVYFAEFDREEWATGKRWLGIVAAGAAASVVFVTIYPGLVQKLPTMAEAFGLALTLVVVFGAVVGAVWWTQTRRKPVGNLVALSVLMLLIGYSTYALIFIRSAADPPIDENDPETTEAIVSYLKREQYGNTPLLKGATFDNATGAFTREEKLFPRRWSPAPQHAQVYAQYDSDFEFFWKYQVGHMYMRYFLWNFVGKAADTQNANWASGLVQTADTAAEARTPSERAGYNVYFGLPLLLGLIGLAFHFVRDWRRAFAVAVLFFITGIGIIVYLNQNPMQPRERDYSYVASFFAYSLWVGIGATGLIALTAEALREKGRSLRLGLAGAMAALLFVAVPGWMTVQNYDDHDRSGRYVAPDFAYNMLQSLAPNAIIFTNGDNDTFPLWYLQEVEGIRRDVRVANLSLLQTPWYIKQLKNQWSRDSAPLPISFTDAEIDALQPSLWEPRDLEIPVENVSAETRQQWGNPTSLPASMRWTVQGRPFGQGRNVVYVNDRVVLDIVIENARQGWPRPVYFATTAAQDSQVDLGDYMQAEGLAMRVVPIQNDEPGGRVVPEVLLDRLSKFRLTNLDDPDAYFDENVRNMTDNYRSSVFGPAAEALARQGRTEEARALLGRIETEMPLETVPADFVSLYVLAEAYTALGDRSRVVELMTEAEPVALQQLETATSQQGINIAVQYYRTVQSIYLENGAFGEAAAFSGLVAERLGDDAFRQSAEELEELYEAPRRPPEPPSADESQPAEQG